jgi:hypothetical protein
MHIATEASHQQPLNAKASIFVSLRYSVYIHVHVNIDQYSYNVWEFNIKIIQNE